MRRPGWRNERGTHAGARRSRPPVRESSLRTLVAVLPLTVLSWLTVFISVEQLERIQFG